MESFEYDAVSQEQQEGNNNQRRRTGFECLYSVPFRFTLLAVVACVISITVTGITMSGDTRKGQTNQQNQQAWSIDKHNMCLPCYLIGNQLELKPLVDQLEKTKKDGTEMCCAYDSNGMSALIKLVLKQRTIKPATPPANEKHGFVIALKKLLPHRKGDSDKGVMGITKQVNDTEKVQGVAIEEDAFVIQITGIYSVYANVFFSVKSDMEQCKVALGSISLRSSTGQHRTLVKLLHTPNASELGAANGAGMFKLYRGDRLQIVMSDRTEVKFDGKSSYAGVVMFAASN